MKFIPVGSKLVNPGLIAWAERATDGSVTAPFAVPVARAIQGQSYPLGAVAPAASDHHTETFTGEEAAELWDGLQQLRP